MLPPYGAEGKLLPNRQTPRPSAVAKALADFVFPYPIHPDHRCKIFRFRPFKARLRALILPCKQKGW
jgi:hypothetical protein